MSCETQVSSPQTSDQERPSAGRPVPLRVLLVTSNLEYGGAQRQVVELANRLVIHGMEAHVCCFSDYVPLAEVFSPGVRLHILQKWFKFDISVPWRLAKLARKLRVNVIHAFLFDAELSARLAGLVCPRAVMIGSERNTDYIWRWRHWLPLRATGFCVDALIANSNAGKEFRVRTLRMNSDRILVVHNGVDVERFHPREPQPIRQRLGLPASGPVVGMFCSFKRQKNHTMFFRVARQVLDRIPEARFICVGAALHRSLQASGEYRAQMEQMVHDMGITAAVEFLGNRDDVDEVYSACDVTILTSRHEGTPNVVLESMACGVPVVVTDVADNRLVVPDGRVGYVVPLDDDQAMAENICRLLTDEVHRRTMGAAGRDWVTREFSLDALYRKTVAIYEHVLATHRR